MMDNQLPESTPPQHSRLSSALSGVSKLKNLRKIFLQSKEELAYRLPYFLERYSYEGDDFGLDIGYFAKTELYLRFLQEDIFSLKLFGIENIPNEGSAIMAGNHNGLMGTDWLMLIDAVMNKHPRNRLIRFLAIDFLYWNQGVGKFMNSMGAVPATYANMLKLIERKELVGIYPAGERSIALPFTHGYDVGEFRTGCVRAAIETQTPIIPVITLGNVETHPVLANSKFLAGLYNAPYFAITATFPFLPFPISFLPLPVKWLVYIEKPIYLDYPPEAANDRELVINLTLQLQQHIQKTTDDLIGLRKSVFKGWNDEDIHEWANSKNEFSARS